MPLLLGPLTVEAFAIVLYNVTEISHLQSVVPDRILGRMSFCFLWLVFSPVRAIHAAPVLEADA